jgi:hypothetical protein
LKRTSRGVIFDALEQKGIFTADT